MKAAPVAVMDAAIVYGARRFFDGVHADLSWPYQGSYDEYDDSLSFFELLHYMIAYDRVVLDDSSVTSVGVELTSFMYRINSELGFEWIATENIGHREVKGAFGVDRIQSGVCRLVASMARAGLLTHNTVKSTAVPWAYKRPDHQDFAAISDGAERFQIPREWIPFVLFLWRGIVYSAFATYRARWHHEPCAYVAAPGRLSAMRAVLSRSEVRRAQYPREALHGLFNDLPDLPRQGFDFSTLTSLSPYERSPLTAELSQLPSQEALRRASQMHKGSEDLRASWSAELFAQSSSCAVGTTYSQTVQGASVQGDLTQIQIVHAIPYED